MGTKKRLRSHLGTQAKEEQTAGGCSGRGSKPRGTCQVRVASVSVWSQVVVVVVVVVVVMVLVVIIFLAFIAFIACVVFVIFALLFASLSALSSSAAFFLRFQPLQRPVCTAAVLANAACLSLLPRGDSIKGSLKG